MTAFQPARPLEMASIEPNCRATVKGSQTATVVGTPVGIHPVALHGIAGAYCAEWDRDAWRAALRPHLEADDPRVDGRERAELFSADAMASRVVEAWRDLLSGCNDPFNHVVRAERDPILDVRGPVPTRGSNDL